jgi:hypothetical protein
MREVQPMPNKQLMFVVGVGIIISMVAWQAIVGFELISALAYAGVAVLSAFATGWLKNHLRAPQGGCARCPADEGGTTDAE